jgi:leucine dehydrogenase
LRNKDKNEALFRTFGKAVNTLNGRYITAEDVGTSVHDMEWVHMETPFVTGVDQAVGGSGNPAPFTAFGTLQGMKAAVEYKLGAKSLKGVKVAMQGLGSVGWNLAKLLKDEGAVIIATDIDAERCERAKKEIGVDEIVKTDDIFGVSCDVFSPNALGASINDKTLDQLKCKVVCGAANNQLEDERHGVELTKRKILYSPDFVVNAGGLINVYVELEGYNAERSRNLCKTIYTNTKEVFMIAENEGIPTHLAADRLAEKRINAMAKVAPRFNTFSREKFDKRR